MKILFLRMFITVVVGFFTTINAFGGVGDIGYVADECASVDSNLKKLCQITTAGLGSPSGEYIHLGGDVYLVLVSGLAHVVNGIYVANLKSERINQFDGYADAELLEVFEAPDRNIWIRVKQRDMSHGIMSEAEILLERRVNPITKTPFLVSHTIREEIDRSDSDLSEEMKSFCSKSKNRKNSKCTGFSKIIYLKEKDIERLQMKSGPTNRNETKRIINAHKKALHIDKNMKFKAFDLLERAGVLHILDVRPAYMSIDQYVNILNDYAVWAYQYGEGRNDLAIEILYNVIKLRPNRAAAYLNMADALEHLAEFGATEYASTPLDNDSIDALKKHAEMFRMKYKKLMLM